MNFSYIKKIKPYVILSMILILMPVITKSSGIVPTRFNGFTVMSDGTVVVGDNANISGWKNNEKLFSFPVTFGVDYALSVNQDDNIVIYTKNARFVLTKDGTPLTFSENNSIDINKLKNHQVIKIDESTSYVRTNSYGLVDSIIRVSDGKQFTEYKTPTSLILVEFFFWEGNLILIVALVAIAFDVKKRRFSISASTEKPDFDEADAKKKRSSTLPGFLKAFNKPEVYDKGSVFSEEFSKKPGERPRFTEDDKKTSSENNSEQILSKENTEKSTENKDTDAT